MDRDRLQALYRELRAAMREKYDRDLPFPELLFDRWERAGSLDFGEGTSVYHSSYIYGEVKVGRNTWIGPFTLLDGTGGGLHIGDYCQLSAGVQVYTHDTVAWSVSRGVAPRKVGPVHIGDCCYLGPQTVVSSGVTIGDHCVVGAGSLVNSDLPSYSLAFGTPCRVQGRVHVSEAGEVSWTLNSRP